jgi:hypothetical protein
MARHKRYGQWGIPCILIFTQFLELRETGYLQKDLVERRFRENKRWYCQFNHTSEKEYTTTMIKAMDECDQYKTSIRSFYYSAQKSV